MKTAAALDETTFPEAPLGNGWPGLNVQIVYEDLSAGLRAKQTADWLEAQLPPQRDMRLKLWRFDLLSEPALREEVTNEAMRADLVLLSAHGQHGLPEDVSTWIREWLTQGTDEPPALIVVFDASAEGSAAANDFLASLRRAAGPRGIEVFPRFYELQSDPAELTSESLRRRAETTTDLLSDMLKWQPSHPPRHWGINE
jgi:hypothetical protein